MDDVQIISYLYLLFFSFPSIGYLVGIINPNSVGVLIFLVCEQRLGLTSRLIFLFLCSGLARTWFVSRALR